MGKRIVYLDEVRIEMTPDEQTWRDVLSPSDQAAVEAGHFELVDKHEQPLPLDADVRDGTEAKLRPRPAPETWITNLMSQSGQNLRLTSVFFVVPEKSILVQPCRRAIDRFRRTGISAGGFHTPESFAKFAKENPFPDPKEVWGCVAAPEYLPDLAKLRNEDLKNLQKTGPWLALACTTSALTPEQRSQKMADFKEVLPCSVPCSVDCKDVTELYERTFRSLAYDILNYEFLLKTERTEEEERVADDSRQMFADLEPLFQKRVSKFTRPITQFLREIAENESSPYNPLRMRSIVLKVDGLEDLWNTIEPKIPRDDPTSWVRAFKKTLDLGELRYG
jgi:hypothetical protein